MDSDSLYDATRTLEAAIKYVISHHLKFFELSDVKSYFNNHDCEIYMSRYRLHRKLFIEKVIQALDIYQERLLF